MKQVDQCFIRSPKRSTMILGQPPERFTWLPTTRIPKSSSYVFMPQKMGHRMPARHEIHQNISASLCRAWHSITHSRRSKARVDMVGNTISTSMCNTERSRRIVVNYIYYFEPNATNLNEKTKIVAFFCFVTTLLTTVMRLAFNTNSQL